MSRLFPRAAGHSIALSVVALAAGGRGRPLAGEALERRRRWYDAETARLARWLRQTAGP